MTESEVSLLDQAAQRRLTARQEAVNDELRRLLDAGLDLLRRAPGTFPRVADIVAAANSSNDAFYRAFGSRDTFLAVIVDDELRRLIDEVGDAMAAAEDPLARTEAAFDALLRRAEDDEVAGTTRAVLSCATGRRTSDGVGAEALVQRVADRLAPELGALGSAEPERDAVTLARSSIGAMDSHLWAGTQPGAGERAYLRGLLGRLVTVRRRPTPGAKPPA